MSDQPDQGTDVDLDQALAAIDPEFNQSMSELAQIANADVDLEVTEVEVDHGDVAPDFDAGYPAEASFGRRAAYLLIRSLRVTLTALRRGLEFAKFAISAFRRGTRAQRVAALLVLALLVLSGVVLRANLRGTWLPSLGEPVIGAFAPWADQVVPLKEDEAWVKLDLAYPAEVYEFLFKPFKVNLRATEGHPQPMGAFEFVIAVDTAEIATEARDRETELSDLVQRLFEGETFPDLETERGKEALKARLKAELETKLGLKRILAVNFKTFVLKP